MNPLALGLLVVGGALLLAGVRLLTHRRRVVGLTLVLVGLGGVATPFIITFWLLR